MSPVHLCLFVLLLASGVLCQVTLLESGPGTVKPSETLRLTCKVTGVSITSSCCCWHWIRQPPGKGLEWLGEICYSGNTYFPESLKSRLSVTRDTSLNEYYLQMSSMRAEDTATFYCVREYNWAFDYWGKGTMVTVTQEPISAPSVFPLVPCCVTVGSSGSVSLGCLATSYLPDPVNITWNSGAITTGVTTPASVYSSSRGTYMRSSQITVPAASLRSATYECSVEHEYTGLKQEKTVKVLPCTEPLVKVVLSPPCDTVHPLTDGRLPAVRNQSVVELICLISDFYPSHLSVQWLANGKPASVQTTPVATKGSDGLFSASSRLTVSKGEYNQGTLYSCSVTHPASGSTTLGNISKCAEPCPHNMGVYLLPPSFEDLYLTQSAHLTCLVANMKTTESFEIFWARSAQGPLKVTTEDPQLHDNGTYSVVSKLAICADDWVSREKFTCTFKHQDLPSPVKVDIVKRKDGSSRPPAVYLLPPSPEELSLRELATITCLVKDFNPNEIFVKWLRAGKEVSTGSYITTEPTQALSGGSYFLYSSLHVDVTDWNEGNTYTCAVGHEALPMHLIQKSIDKFTGKPTSINVSLVMSDTAGSCY